MPNRYVVQGADALTPQGWIRDSAIVIEDGKISAINPVVAPDGVPYLDAKGLQLLPGIVDIHGDAFERMICPRPGVHLPLPLAIAENDRSLLASGITTFFYAINDSYEPGLRSRAMVRQILAELQAMGPAHLNVNSCVHIRHEQSNTDDLEELCEWIQAGTVNLLSLNDHVPPAADETTLGRYTKGLRQRVRLAEDEIRALIQKAIEQRAEGEQQTEQLVALCHQVGIPVASHDDDSVEQVAISARRRVAIAEFPASVELAAQSQDYGAAVLMGAPNLVRGGSHVGYMSVKEAAQAGVLDCLCSDYHYPSLFHAPFLMVSMDLMSFEDAWKLVSETPARAARIHHQTGAIAPGLDADFLLVKPCQSLPLAIARVYVRGREVARFMTA